MKLRIINVNKKMLLLQKKTTAFFILINICILAFISCVSTNLPSQGPFYRAYLVSNNLMVEIIEQSVKIRIIYPYIAKDSAYKKIIDTFFVSKIDEYKIFSTAMKETNFLQVIAPQAHQVFYLSIYSYTVLDQADTISIAFQVQYKTTNTIAVNRWYTLNIDKANFSIIEDETLFSNPLSANTELISYAFEDIIRQRTERSLPKITKIFDPSADSNVEAEPLSFVLLPSISQKYRYSGIRLYISQFTAGTTEPTSYAVNIPISVLLPYLRNNIKPLFNNEKVPFITRNLDTIRQLIYPDLINIF